MITFHEIQQSRHGRLLEMEVDRLTSNRSIIMQFWSDVRVYGLDEALVYLRGMLGDENGTGVTPDLSNLKDVVERLGGKLPA